MKTLMIVFLLVACVALVRSQDGCYSEPDDPNSNPCTYMRCGWGATCRNDNGRARCECPSICTDIYDPVCGSDGQTYSNTCRLNVSNCQNMRSVTVVHKGRCDGLVDDI